MSGSATERPKVKWWARWIINSDGIVTGQPFHIVSGMLLMVLIFGWGGLLIGLVFGEATYAEDLRVNGPLEGEE